MTKISDAAVKLYDGMRNALSGLGGSTDPQTAAQWYHRSITQQEIETAYRGSWLAKKIHDVPPTDMIAPWRVWQATPDQVTAIEKEERRLGLKKKVRKAMIFARMYGGSAIMMGILGDDPKDPLELDRVRQNGLSYLHVLTRHEVTISEIDMDPGSPSYGEPMFYLVSGGGTMVPVHRSRMVRFTFGELPDQLAFAESSWGDPLMASLRDAVANADSAQGNFAALTSKALTSTLSTPNLLELVSTKDGERKFIEKTRIMQAFRSMFNLNIVSGAKNSSEVGETLTDTTFSFANIPEMGLFFIQMAAAAAGMPMTKLAAMSPAGLNSTGTGDENNYIQLLSSGRELELTPAIQMIDECLIRSALGTRDEKIYFTWEPFQSESEKDKVTNAKTRAEAFKILSEANTVPSEVLMKITKAQLIDSGDYPGAEDAYAEYEAAGGDFEPVEAPEASNDNTVLAAATEGLSAQGKSASVAARDAIALCDSVPRPLYVSRMVLNREEIQTWATEQGLGELQPDLHVTILYSRQPVDWMAMDTTWADKDGDGSGKLQVTAGGPRCVEPLGDRTAVLMFSNTDMQWRHEEMVRAGASHDYNDFTLHISLTDKPVDLSNVVPYRGTILFGAELFQEIREDAI